MLARIRKWGNSLALRIPAAFARETGIESGSEVDLTIEEGRLIVTPRRQPRYSLEELLGDVASTNLHGEIDTGSPRGGENW